MSRSRVLVFLIVLLLVAVWYAWQETPRQQRVVSERESPQNSSRSEAEVLSAEMTPALSFSSDEEVSFEAPRRDLFRPLYRPPVITRQPVAPPKPAPVIKAPPPPPPKPRPVVVAPVGPKPIPPLNVLGFLQKGEDLTVFLASRQGDVYLVKKGERFADDLLVRELDDFKIVISRNLTDAGVTLKVGEKKNQRMAIPKLQSGRPSVPVINVNVPKTEPPAPAPTEVGENK